MSFEDDQKAYAKYEEFCKRVGVKPRSFDVWQGNRRWIMNDGTIGPSAWTFVDKVRKVNEFDEES